MEQYRTTKSKTKFNENYCTVSIILYCINNTKTTVRTKNYFKYFTTLKLIESNDSII